MAWKPSSPFITPLKLLAPSTSKAAGVNKKTYARDGPVIMASLKTYGGTETEQNGAIAVVDTAIIETNYRPDITADCALYSPIDGKTYEITSLENIEMRSRYLRAKVRAIKGGA